jgi:hypothetical protein
MGPTHVFTGIPYNLDEIKLGSLIANIKQPNKDAHNPPRPLHKESDFTFRDEKGFNYICSLDMKFSIRAQLTRLLTFPKRHSMEDNLHLHSKKGRVYELTRPQNLFHEFCGDASVRRWLINCVEGGGEPYLITGLRTFTNVKLVDESELEKALSVSFKWPKSTVAEMVDGVRVLDSWGVVSAPPSNRGEEPSDFTSERIYGISVRKICFKWFSQGELNDEMTSKSNIWSYAKAKRPEIEHFVEVNLGDEDTDPGVASDFIPSDEDDMSLKTVES